MNIFETYTASYPEVLDRRVVDLCLVRKCWNEVANRTPQLWTKINLFFPFGEDHLCAALKRVHASQFKGIDVSINFHDPAFDGSEPKYDDIEDPRTRESIWVKVIASVLRGTEERWRSIKVVSETWLPLYKLTESWTSSHLPLLESIMMKRDNGVFGMLDVSFDPIDPPSLTEPLTLFGPHAALPKLRNLCLSGVHVEWDDALFRSRNLRGLVINNITYDVAPLFKEFAAMLSSTPRLEYLDVAGFCPTVGFGHIPVVHLPALKVFVFGWKSAELGCDFLRMFQVGNTLENLTLKDTESRPGSWTTCWRWGSDEIFEALTELGSADSGDNDNLPPGPFISLRNVKKLAIVWAKADRPSLIPFLSCMTKLEDVLLDNVDRGVVEGFVLARTKRAMFRNPRSHFRLLRRPGNPVPLEQYVEDIKRGGVPGTMGVVGEAKVLHWRFL